VPALAHDLIDNDRDENGLSPTAVTTGCSSRCSHASDPAVFAADVGVSVQHRTEAASRVARKRRPTLRGRPYSATAANRLQHARETLLLRRPATAQRPIYETPQPLQASDNGLARRFMTRR
jgi:hypothetical protein